MTETDLRWKLRQLPREIEPTRDLWPGIEAAITRPRVRMPHRWLVGLAMAASLVLATGLFLKAGNGGSVPQPGLEQNLSQQIVHHESRAITDEYQSALRQFDGAPVSPQIRPSLEELDRSVVQIRRAIDADPSSVFLLQQLRKTYSRRLELTQRAVIS